MVLLTPQAVDAMKAQLQQGQVPPEVVEMITRFLRPGFDLTRTLISLLVNMVGLGLFAMIGGIIAAAIFSKKTAE
jgi:hypothetical protein